MQILDFVHRWAGGLVGLALAVLGLSGALLVHKDAWLRAVVPHAADARVDSIPATAAALDRLFAADSSPRAVVLASDTLGIHIVRFKGDGGAYADQNGAIVTQWEQPGDRIETWLFDLHHHLLAGDTGETIAGILGLAGLAFVITGSILWWRTRRTFRLRALPARLSVPAVRRHHRDLGIVAAPLLVMVMLTGAMLIFKPVAALVLSPFSSRAEMEAAAAPPKQKGGAMAKRTDWQAMLITARQHFPDAEPRVVILPRKPGDLLSLRVRQPAEWLPNGRTTLWFDAADGRLVAINDALMQPRGSQLFNLTYPLHAAKVGGLAYRLVMTAVGLALFLLGSLAVASFWTTRVSFRRRTRRATSLANP